MKYELGKSSRLKGKSSIDELFKKGSSLRKGPLRLVYLRDLTLAEDKIGFVAPKRYLKKAVDRNKVKRLLREAYRLNQHKSEWQEKGPIKMMLLYQSPEIPELEQLSSLVKQQIKTLNKRLNNK